MALVLEVKQRKVAYSENIKAIFSDKLDLGMPDRFVNESVLKFLRKILIIKNNYLLLSRYQRKTKICGVNRFKRWSKIMNGHLILRNQ